MVEQQGVTCSSSGTWHAAERSYTPRGALQLGSLFFGRPAMGHQVSGRAAVGRQVSASRAARVTKCLLAEQQRVTCSSSGTWHAAEKSYIRPGVLYSLAHIFFGRPAMGHQVSGRAAIGRQVSAYIAEMGRQVPGTAAMGRRVSAGRAATGHLQLKWNLACC